MNDLRVGFVGGGWVSTNRHMPAAAAQPNLKLIGLVSTERNLKAIEGARLGARFGLTRFSPAMDADWVRAETDALIIGTPPETHYELVMQALSLGKHVLVEKPFAMNTAQADEMIAAADSAGLRLALIHNLQFSRAAAAAFGALERGDLGELRGAFGFQTSNHERRLPRWYKSLPLGLFTDESPHLIYMLLHLLPSARQMSAYVAPPMAETDNTPALVSTHFLNGAGISGSLHMTFVGAISEWLLVIFGSRQTAVIDFFRDIHLTLPNDGRHETIDVLRTSMRALAGHVGGFAASGNKHVRGALDYGNHEVFRRFAAAVLDDAPLDRISAQDGRAVVEVMETINAAAPHLKP